jgi:hypothetical protein
MCALGCELQWTLMDAGGTLALRSSKPWEGFEILARASSNSARDGGQRALSIMGSYPQPNSNGLTPVPAQGEWTRAE